MSYRNLDIYKISFEFIKTHKISFLLQNMNYEFQEIS